MNTFLFAAHFFVCIVVLSSQNFADTRPCSCVAGRIDEDFSDNCMGQLMGTGRADKRRCVVTNDCLEAMLARGHVEYQMTHQLLYTMLAEQVSETISSTDWCVCRFSRRVVSDKSPVLLHEF